MNMVATQEPMYGWNTIAWKQVERSVFKLQKRIYQAEQRGDVKTVRTLQRLLMKSRSTKLLAVRRVTQDNQGKKTAGIDGVKSLTPTQRLALVDNLKITEKSKPVRRVWIPKPGSDEHRPLGIPTMKDRALQALVKMVLEPQWEAKFEANSYGFRPGRSCWDAIGAIFININLKAKWVLDADIAKCFDRINHDALLKKINQSPALTRQVKAWLKAGMMEGGRLFPTSEGTPQGGVISPLLANIALHGLEEVVKEAYPRKKNAVALIRYADDFVVIHQDRAVVEDCQVIISEWLKDMGLELKPSKTRITHTLHTDEGQAGFDFLGHHIRQYPVGKTHSGTNPGNKQPLGFKTIIKPSKEAIKRHRRHTQEVINNLGTATQEAVIRKLNPVVRGWTNYFSTVCSKATFGQEGMYLFKKLFAWAVHRHPTKGKKWIAAKYWGIKRGLGWEFITPNNSHRLSLHGETAIRRHPKIQGSRSPFDGDWTYWSLRMKHYPATSLRDKVLLKRQGGTCFECGLYFKPEDVAEVDHIVPKEHGGKDAYYNLQLLHRHCHDKKTAEDRLR